MPQAVPFFDLCLAKIEKLNYPKDHLHLFIYSNAALHDDLIKEFVDKHGKKYASAKFVLSGDELDERAGRQLALWVALSYMPAIHFNNLPLLLSSDKAMLKHSDYLFVVDGDAHIDDPEVLRELLKLNKFVAPH